MQSLIRFNTLEAIWYWFLSFGPHRSKVGLIINEALHGRLT